MSGTFHILSIDGGGFRGVYAAHILRRMEEEFHTDWSKSFDLMAGTSTGAIIAAGLACGVTATDIANLYEKHGKQIFTRRRLCRLGLLGSRYRAQHLAKLIQEVIGEKTFEEIETPLILPATDIGNGCVHVFKSAYDKEFLRDKNVLVRDAVLASCAAPTYFDPQTVDNKYLLADGGLWANSPAFVAVIDAKRRLGQDIEDLRVLSLGTGTARRFYTQNVRGLSKLQGWGFASRWGRGRFIDMLLNLQAQNANNMLGLLLRPEQILRLNFESDSHLPLDDHDEYLNLVSRADRDFTHNAETIKAFLRGIPMGDSC